MRCGLFSIAKPAILAAAPGPNASFTPCHQNIKNWKNSLYSDLKELAHYLKMFTFHICKLSLKFDFI